MLTDVLVPGNRWDLLAPYPEPRPEVTVVVTHYRQPRQLAATWAALCAQTLPPAEVVIADYGSPERPRNPVGGPPVRVVTQPDRGFRAAAARNLGVRHSGGEVLVFLDADTVPEPGFLAALTRRAAVCPDVLAVGRRRHADLSGLAPGADPRTLPELPEPAWLREGYAGSRDLLDADGRSFRYVISAVLACRRSLFDDLGGFDERFVGYGGEDWDLAYRAWNAGAVLVHERAAVAWHDGPDWAGRPDEQDRKDQEAARLAALVPEPSTRGAVRPGPGGPADVLVDLDGDPSPADAASIARSLDVQTHDDLLLRGPAPWTADQLRRARVTLRVRAPLPSHAVGEAVRALVERDLAEVTLLDGGCPVGVARSTRATGRARRWAGRLPEATVRAAFGSASVDVSAG
ncbi:glycosyltransferase [Pseudonocardia saturnea]